MQSTLKLRMAAAWIAPLFALSACEASPGGATASVDSHEQPAAATAATISRPPASGTRPKSVASPASAGIRSCSSEIGAAAAARRVAICRAVSPATRPPCNAANSCAMIEDEIARSCALFDGKGPAMAGWGPAPKSVEAAAAVVRRYYSAINARDYATAWRQWGDDGRPGQTYAAFAAGFAHTSSTRVTIGAAPPGDAGAGSIFQPMLVTVDAALDDGRHQRFGGTYVVRRVNDVKGASAAKLRWHLDPAQLRPLSSR